MLDRIPRVALCAIVLALLLASLLACGRGQTAEESDDSSSTDPADSSAVSEETLEESEEEDAPPAIPVEVAELTRGPMEAVLKSSATLEAESSIEVVSESARRVQELLVEEGDWVSQGTVLLRLQNAEQRSALERAKATLEHSKSELTRQEELHQQGLTTEQALSNARYSVQQDEILVTDAERELGYTTVRAPIAGTVTLRMVNLGDNVSVGQPLFEIVDFESLVARLYIPEKNLSQLAVGQDARIIAEATRSEAYAGAIKRIAPVVDARSGTVKVTVAVGAQPGLRPGLYVDITLVTAIKADALRLPKRALVYDKDQIFAYRLGVDRKVQRLAVIPGLVDRNFVEPLNGFSAGDSLVVAGQASLKDGSRVRVVNEDAAEAEAPSADDRAGDASETEQP